MYLESLRGLGIPLLDEHIWTRVADWDCASDEPEIEATMLFDEALIDSTLNEPALLAEGEAIEQWLAAHPSPR